MTTLNGLSISTDSHAQGMVRDRLLVIMGRQDQPLGSAASAVPARNTKAFKTLSKTFTQIPKAPQELLA